MNANQNLLYSRFFRSIGSSPRIQNFRPSRLSSGKMNRLVNVLSVRQVATRFSTLMKFCQYGRFKS